MSQNRRMLTYIAIALIVGAALALAVAISNSDAGSSAVESRRRRGPTAATSVYSDDAGTAALAAADPAKEQPLLDKFTSKDPFIPFPTPGSDDRGQRAPVRRVRRRRATWRPRSRWTERTTRWSRATRCRGDRPPSSPSPG